MRIAAVFIPKAGFGQTDFLWEGFWQEKVCVENAAATRRRRVKEKRFHSP